MELIVRRGALRRFDKLREQTVGLSVVVSWDRRLEERRSETAARVRDRRGTERRQRPPFTWDLADFVVKTESGEAKTDPKPKP